jgi:hypothetical protein
MASTLITYDLRAPGRNYNALYDAIKGLGSWWHCLDSNWIVQTNLTTVQVRDRLAVHLDANDKLLVVTLTGVGAWKGFDQNCSDWLTQNL